VYLSKSNQRYSFVRGATVQELKQQLLTRLHKVFVMCLIDLSDI